MDKLNKMLAKYDKNIETLNTVLPILVELSCLASNFSNADIRARSLLSQNLRLSELPNNGYL